MPPIFSHERHATSHHSHRQRVPKTPSSTLFTALFLALLASPTTSIPLSAFQPPIDPSNLSTTCASIYTTQLDSCTASDFATGATCSSPCISALVSTSEAVYQNCQSAQDNQLLIQQFLVGRGIQVLCPSVVVVTMSGGGNGGGTATATLTQVLSQTESVVASSSAVQTSSSQSQSIASSSSQSQRQSPSATATVTSTMDITMTVPNTHTQTAVATFASSQAGVSYSSPSGTTTATMDAKASDAARQDHCVEYEGNPFDPCEQGQGNGSGALRLGSLASVWRAAALAMSIGGWVGWRGM